MGGSAFELQLGLGVLPENCTQLALLGNYSAFRVQDKYRDEVQPDGVKAVDSYLATLMLRHYFGSGWSADLLMPTGTVRVEIEDGDPNYLSGFGDLELKGAYDFAALWGAGGYRPSVELRLGMGLPTGKQGFVTDAKSVFPPNLLALGIGAYSLTAQLDCTQSVHRQFALKLSGQMRYPLTWSELGIKYGSMVNYGVGLLWKPIARLSALVEINAQHIQPNQRRDEGELADSGGDVFAARLQLAVNISRPVALGIHGRVPFWAEIEGRQLVERFSVSAFIALAFGQSEDD